MPAGAWTIRERASVTREGRRRMIAGILCLAALSFTGCGPAKPGAYTPVAPPATLWKTHTQAGHRAYLLGNYQEAEQQYLRALDEAERLKIAASRDGSGEAVADDPAVPTSLNNLATFYVAVGRYEEAEPLLDRAVTLTRANLGPGHPYLAVTLQNLASLREAQGELAEAQPLLEEALEIDERALGASHPKVGHDLNRLAELAAAQQKLGEAEALFYQGLAIREDNLGPDHPEVAVSLMSLARFYAGQDQNALAEALYRRALAIREKKLSPDDPVLADTLRHYAVFLRKTSRNEYARQLELRADRIDARASRGGPFP